MHSGGLRDLAGYWEHRKIAIQQDQNGTEDWKQRMPVATLVRAYYDERYR